MEIYSCNNFSRIAVVIRKDYHEKFDKREFILEDFELDNAMSFSYFQYAANTPYSMKYILLRLKNPGIYYVQQAREHLGKLDFVEMTWFSSANYAGLLLGACNEERERMAWESVKGGPDFSCVRMELREEYHDRFVAKGFILSDFQLENAMDFSYWYFQTDNKNSIGRKFIWVLLKVPDELLAHQALKHIKKLQFAKDAWFNGSAYPGVRY